MNRDSGEDLTFSRKVVGGLIGAINNTHSVGSYHQQATGQAAAMDEATAELLSAVRELRADLERVRSSPETAVLDEALARIEEEITVTGQASPGQRERLLAALQDNGTVLSLLASAGAVAGLLGH